MIGRVYEYSRICPRYRENPRIRDLMSIPKILWTFSAHWAVINNSRLFEKRWIFLNKLECSQIDMWCENSSMAVMLAYVQFLSFSLRYADRHPDLVHECTGVLIVLVPLPQTMIIVCQVFVWMVCHHLIGADHERTERGKNKPIFISHITICLTSF
jgi:hypothetical protein